MNRRQRGFLSLLLLATGITRAAVSPVDTRQFDSHADQARQCEQRKEYHFAIAHYHEAIKTKPHDYRLHFELAKCYQALGKHDDAIEEFDKAIECAPDRAEIYYEKGVLLQQIRRMPESVTALQKSVDLRPHDIIYRFHLANSLTLEDRCDEAIAIYRELTERIPQSTSILHNLAFALKRQERVAEALAVYEQILELTDDAKTHFSYATTLLALGQLEKGWQENEWRWHTDGDSPRQFSKPEWDGGDLTGKRILAYCEQGLGDTLQFIRYIKVLKEMGAYTIVEAQGPIEDYLRELDYIDHVYPRGQYPPPFDCQIALMSIPKYLSPTLDDIPNEMPYLQADEELVRYWQERLATDTNFKIGICWTGNLNYRSPTARYTVAKKSTHIAKLAPLLQLPNVSVYSLQKISGMEQKELLPYNATLHEIDVPDKEGFVQFAALIKNLDLVITIDTSICHFAAGMGTETWNMLPTPCDWRWLVGTNETAWYPNMRLFRQPTPGDWDSVIHDIVEAVKARLATHA